MLIKVKANLMGPVYYISRLVGQENWAFLLLLTHGCVRTYTTSGWPPQPDSPCGQPFASLLPSQWQCALFSETPCEESSVAASEDTMSKNKTVCSAGQATLQGLWTTPAIVCHHLCSG